MRLENTFEGGTNNATITTSNSGSASGDAFTDVSANMRYSTAQAAHGSVSALFPTGSDGWLSWLGLVDGVGSRWGRVYLRATGNFALYFNFADEDFSLYALWISAAGGQAQLELLGWNTSRQTVDSTTVTWPANQWVRVEIFTDNSTQQLEARIYFDSDSNTPDVTLSGTTTQTAGSWADFYIQGTANSDNTLWVDDLAFTDEGWLGPPGGSTTVPITGDDSATLADARALITANTRSDAAATTEHANLAASPAGADAGQLGETAGITQQTQIETADDAATGDAAAVLAGVAVPDAGAVVDDSTITTPVVDAGQSGEHTTLSSGLAAGDTAALAETTQIGTAAGDQATAGEARSLQAATSTGGDAAVVEVAHLVAAPLALDFGQLGEQVQVGRTEGPAAQDAGQLGEHAHLGAAAQVADVAGVGSQVTVAAAVARADSAILAETAHVDQTAGPTTGDVAQIEEHAQANAVIDAADAGGLAVMSTVTGLVAAHDDAALTGETAHLDQTASPIITDAAALAEARALHAAARADDHTLAADHAAVNGAAAAADHALLVEAVTVTVPGIDTPAADTATAVDQTALEAAAALTDQAIAAFLAELTADGDTADRAELAERALVTVAGMPDDITIRVVPTQRLWRGETVRG